MNVLPLICRKLWIVAALLPALVGCSTVRLTYGQGPMLAYWWLDGYVDIGSEQAALVRVALEDWFAWHRATQLADYAALLVSAQKLAVDKVTPAQVCALYDTGQRRLELAFEQAVPAMVTIVRTFTPAQLRHLEQRYAKGDEELERDHLKRPAAERQEAVQKRWQERFESFYGPLDEAQRRLLVEGLAASPFDAQAWLNERRLRQQDIVAGLRRLLAERADAPLVQAALRAFAAQASRSPRAEYRAYRERLNDANCSLIARMHRSASPAQRQRAVAKLKDWEDDLRALTRSSSPLRVPAAPSPAEG